jgi:hypothetical protein
VHFLSSFSCLPEGEYEYEIQTGAHVILLTLVASTGVLRPCLVCPVAHEGVDCFTAAYCLLLTARMRYASITLDPCCFPLTP